MRFLRGSLLLAAVCLGAQLAPVSLNVWAQQPPPGQRRPPNPDGWQIPPGAAEEANPLPADAKVLGRGADIYRSKCERCHGATGKGDGPDMDPDGPPDDLTDPARAPRNPDGVMFYKIWNGRRKPKMPGFKDELSRDDAWAAVHYAKSLRRASQ
jgi:mono/diheme cytochrome c family protein